MGNLIAVRRGDDFRVMLASHMDEIGFMVKYVEKEGFLRFAPIGGWYAPMLAGQRVCAPRREGPGPRRARLEAAARDGRRGAEEAPEDRGDVHRRRGRERGRGTGARPRPGHAGHARPPVLQPLRRPRLGQGLRQPRRRRAPGRGAPAGRVAVDGLRRLHGPGGGRAEGREGLVVRARPRLRHRDRRHDPRRPPRRPAQGRARRDGQGARSSRSRTRTGGGSSPTRPCSPGSARRPRPAPSRSSSRSARAARPTPPRSTSRARASPRPSSRPRPGTSTPRSR